jgi:hypothetical protein
MAGVPEVFGEVVMNGFVFQILMRDLSDSRVCLSIISRALSADSSPRIFSYQSLLKIPL